MRSSRPVGDSPAAAATGEVRDRAAAAFRAEPTRSDAGRAGAIGRGEGLDRDGRLPDRLFSPGGRDRARRGVGMAELRKHFTKCRAKDSRGASGPRGAAASAAGADHHAAPRAVASEEEGEPADPGPDRSPIGTRDGAGGHVVVGRRVSGLRVAGARDRWRLARIRNGYQRWGDRCPIVGIRVPPPSPARC